MSDDPMRARMAAAIAEDLGVSVEDASRAMHAAWEATKDDEKGTPFSRQPDLSNPGQALARRVQAALEREFSGEELFPVVVVVQARTNHIGLAVTDARLRRGRAAPHAGPRRREAIAPPARSVARPRPPEEERGGRGHAGQTTRPRKHHRHRGQNARQSR
jgi:hypothetical protein